MSNTFTEVEKNKLSRLNGSGLIEGGLISINADTTKFNVAAGSGQIVDCTDPSNPVYRTIRWNAFTAQTDSFLTTQLDTQILIQWDGTDNTFNGTISQISTLPTPAQTREKIYIGKTVHTNLTVINAVVNVPVAQHNPILTIADMARAIGIVNESGNVITSNGANLKLNRSAGSTFRFSANFHTDKNSPNFVTSSAGTAVSFQYRYRNGSGGFTTSAATTDLVPGSYDDGDGTLGSVGPAEWTIQRFYYFTIGTMYVTYGQVKYQNLDDAIAAVEIENPVVDPQFTDASLRAWIVMRGNTTDLSDTTNNRIVRNGRFSPAI